MTRRETYFCVKIFCFLFLGIGAVPSTGVNFSSIDLEKDTLEMPKSSRSSIRDYEPWAERKKQVMMPIFDDCVIPKDNIELAQRYVKTY